MMRPSPMVMRSAAAGEAEQMLLFVSAIALIAGATATIPSVSILCIFAGAGCIILDVILP
jgi:hypothetical protein